MAHSTIKFEAKGCEENEMYCSLKGTDASEDEIPARLLALNQERAAAES